MAGTSVPSVLAEINGSIAVSVAFQDEFQARLEDSVCSKD